MREELAEMFNEIAADLGDLGAVLITSDGKEHPVIAPSVGMARTSSEQGESEMPDAVIRMRYDDYDAAGIGLRDVVTLRDCCAVEHKLRIREAVNTGGIMRLMCEAVHG